MKNLLIYQSTEYDCGPTTLTNAIRYLFDREEIYPDIVKYIDITARNTGQENIMRNFQVNTQKNSTALL